MRRYPLANFCLRVKFGQIGSVELKDLLPVVFLDVLDKGTDMLASHPRLSSHRQQEPCRTFYVHHLARSNIHKRLTQPSVCAHLQCLQSVFVKKRPASFYDLHHQDTLVTCKRSKLSQYGCMKLGRGVEGAGIHKIYSRYRRNHLLKLGSSPSKLIYRGLSDRCDLLANAIDSWPLKTLFLNR